MSSSKKSKGGVPAAANGTAASASASAGSSMRLTVFGMDLPPQEIERLRVLLYGSQELSEKDKKQQAKLEKFMKKQAAMAAAAAAAEADDGDKKDKKEKKKKEKAPDPFVYKAPAPGEKKDLSGMARDYHPKYVEDSWYAWWSKCGFNKPEYNENHSKIACADPENPTFTIVIPPPNVTGSLHLGHALTTAIEDALTRWNRMLGKQTLWNPGCDHAGIATQAIVEKTLWREQKLRRTDLGREKFLEKVWQWKNAKGDRIYEQLRGLGASCDWDREAFTMSPRCVKAVEESFIRLHEDGLIYRSSRLVNWSCKLNSAISDIEVEKIELTGRKLLSVPDYDEKIEFGLLTSFAYKFADGSGEIVIATTRPETMLGDVAVAVNAKDTRYTSAVGKKLVHPFIPDRHMVVIADEIAQMEFGTGAVKITPAHDVNDYECGLRHNLPLVSVITREGNIAEGCGEFSGMKRFHARNLIIQRLKELGLFRGQTDNAMVVPKCSRSGDIIEPLSVPQWFCNCKKMAELAVDAVRKGELKLIPSTFEATWYNWLENIRDWCISRQLWWGHRIPAYFISSKDGSIPAGNTVDDKYWVSAHNEDEARTKAAKRFNVKESVIVLEQDPDVLDTWYSSGIFPISIFNWPNENNAEFTKFYPGHLLETGHDILFFWVARMVMMCTYLTGKLPFKEVYLHSIIRDKEGRKMSKSLGNVVDPMDVCAGITLEELHERLKGGNLDPKEYERAVEGQKRQFPGGIKECGVDALRFALCNFAVPGRDINLDVQRIFGYRTFCNKIYNAFKLVLDFLGPDFQPLAWNALTRKESAADRCMLSQLSSAIVAVNAGMRSYDFPATTNAIYNLWMHEFANFYLELAKAVIRNGKPKEQAACRNVLYKVVENGLRLLAPFKPFLAEELWQRLPRCRGEHDKVDPPSVHVAAFPVTAILADREAELLMSFIHTVIDEARSLRTDLPSNETAELHLKAATDDTFYTLEAWAEQIGALVKANVKVLKPTEPMPAHCTMSTCPSVELFISLGDRLDAGKVIERLEKKLTALQDAASTLSKNEQNDGYMAALTSEQRGAHQSRKQEIAAEIQSVEAGLAHYRGRVTAV